MHKKEKPISYVVPEEGSLALLALGAVGIRAWREARQKEKKDEE